MTAPREAGWAVVGGGLVGMALAYGLARRGQDVTVFDEGDVAFRASRGNFGLVWVQGKGVAMPDYARWTRASARLWPAFRDRLTGETGVGLDLAQPGGLNLYLSEAEAETEVAGLTRLRDALGDYPFEFLGPNRLRKLLPAVGPEVVGGTFHPEDGHLNPLYLLRALHAAFAKLGGRLVNGATVARVEPAAGAFRLTRGGETWQADRVVLCAGLDNARLAPMVGLAAPVRPNRGQVLITERMRPFLDLPVMQVRQTGEGTVQIGDSSEDAGLDDRSDARVIGTIARRAARLFPVLEHARVVRAWSALRIMSPDGHPIYDRSETCPGAAVVCCHSGVTLAAAHAEMLAGWLMGAAPSAFAPDFMEAFSARRFPLQAA